MFRRTYQLTPTLMRQVNATATLSRWMRQSVGEKNTVEIIIDSFTAEYLMIRALERL